MTFPPGLSTESPGQGPSDTTRRTSLYGYSHRLGISSVSKRRGDTGRSLDGRELAGEVKGPASVVVEMTL
jgi:hypothetical protein